ncbi:SAM-dependent methyltransferase [Amycolatopsis cihanbeyliensis]|uniref:S-adenosyl methyltransferase n=1 Tax=Amycolatopsis cihanbeyliensis TaxID=1128664 RepID=A0A542DR39_AMYCI|nr:SAM-dependent methyltransferase [Amycolatopsis cihanbeyliensis]TQJ05568.1 S-adenosyl methyltransferase [Amycolatopsis cihanbeyliensis]
MTENLAWTPAEIDIAVPNVARVYDFLLGGAHNFESDRTLADKIEQSMPGVRDVVRLNRSFLRRAVLFMVESGIRQFLDIGSGIPTVGNVHEVAQQADPECRVVYVDKEPVAVRHSGALLAGNDRAMAVEADVCSPGEVLGDPAVLSMLDFDQPVGLLNLLLWHFIPDEADPPGLLAGYRNALAPGSYLAITHTTYDSEPDELRGAVDEVRRRSKQQAFPRTYDEITALFDGYELVEPGVVGCAAWRPGGPGDFSEHPSSNARLYAGVGRKPQP